MPRDLTSIVVDNYVAQDPLIRRWLAQRRLDTCTYPQQLVMDQSSASLRPHRQEDPARHLWQRAALSASTDATPIPNRSDGPNPPITSCFHRTLLLIQCLGRTRRDVANFWFGTLEIAPQQSRCSDRSGSEARSSCKASQAGVRLISRLRAQSEGL